MAFIFIALFLWTLFKFSPALDATYIINLPTAIIAGCSFITSLILHFVVPKKNSGFFLAIPYLLLATAVAMAFLGSRDAGGMSSPFLAIWLLISISAGIFGLIGTIPILISTSIFTAIEYMSGDFSVEKLITIVICSLLPLIIGAIIWRKQSDAEERNGENRAFRNLANELTEVASKSEVVINAIGDGVIAIDGKGIIQLINPAAQRLIGWGKQDALSLNYKSVLQMVNQKNETLDPVSDPIQQVLNTNQQVRTNDLSLITKNEKKMIISLVVSPVGDMGSGIIAVFHDITKEKAEEREQAEFISTASHEMRTPVASIEGYLGLAMNPQTAQIDNRARDFILKAHAAAEHLGHLFQDLLDVSKADDGRISNNPKVCEVVKFTNDIVEGLQAKATEKGLRLTYKPMDGGSNERTIPPVYYVNLDNDHIREITNNLIENAIKYTPRGEVVVDVSGDEDHVVISVKDSGIGIPAEDMPHLFQKFYRVDNKDTREIGGTGLGLYLSRRLTEIMSGRIWAESVYTRGSTFFVEFPRISGQEVTRLSEQEAIIAQEKANQAKPSDPGLAFTPDPTPTQVIDPVVVQPARSVPRGQALTPEQIAAYVAKQRSLIQQQQQQAIQNFNQVQSPAYNIQQPAQQPAQVRQINQPVARPQAPNVTIPPRNQ